jgi:hypothetical protein
VSIIPQAPLLFAGDVSAPDGRLPARERVPAARQKRQDGQWRNQQHPGRRLRNGRRGENLECDQVGDIASARRVARDDDACKFLMFGSVISPAGLSSVHKETPVYVSVTGFPPAV